jgi:hypothetical protein
MADQTETQNLPSEYPPPTFPTVYADGVLNISNTATIVKFYLSRFDPSFTAAGPQRSQAFAQVIMPMDGFMATFTFFEAAINRYLSQGTITEERLNEMRRVNAGIRWTA